MDKLRTGVYEAFLEWFGLLALERIEPTDCVFLWWRYQHLQRYRWVGSQAVGRTVADVGCGSGWGSEILLKAGASGVCGFDIAWDALYASRGNHDDRILIAQADLKDLPLANHSVDLLVCFETIEHIEDIGGGLREMARVLAPEGIFFCSTPNREIYAPGSGKDHRPFNRFHVREYSRTEFSDLLSNYFGNVELFGQVYCHETYLRILALIGKTCPRIAFYFHQLVNLLTLPWESEEKHKVLCHEAGSHWETLIARCSKPQGCRE